MDHIIIKDLEIYGYHGLYPEEKKLGQKFLISLDLETDLYPAAITQDLALSVDYGALSNKLKDMFLSESIDLIETVAEKVASLVLEEYNMVYGVEVEIKKPWAPIGLPIDYASVKLRRVRTTAFIGLGSNQGDRISYLKKAVEMLDEIIGISVKKTSSVYETKPWGNEDQNDFLNQVIEISTYLPVRALLKILQDIEHKLDRKRGIHWGPRTIDLDIILFGDQVINSDNLIIPHPYMTERNFVLEPLSEIAPHFTHPVEKKLIRVLWKELSNRAGTEPEAEK